jgi:hypothetical protein
MSAGLLALTMAIYVLVAVSEFRSGHAGLGIAFAGYAFSNIGLIMATLK